MEKDSTITRAEEVLRIEAESILQLIGRLDENFSRAVDIIYRSPGRVIVTGIGKSGLIGKKIVATMTSTGTQALFLHPVEGLHGDLGIVTKDDVVLAISNSGETEEVNRLIGSIQKIGAPLISFTGNPSSTMARASNAVINVGVEREACPFGLAPTSSSTASLAMGDALAVALIDKHKFSEKDFYKFHPGGSLGQRLRAKVRDVMISGPDIPKVYTGTPAIEAISVLDEKNKGFLLVTDRQNCLLGILTDGDVRRLVRKGASVSGKSIDEIMTRSPKSIKDDWSLAQTIEFMQRDEITALAIVNCGNQLQGYIHLHDILGRGGTIRISISG
ncbi:arabinose-5-phosphate isomerase [Syntrophus gentianae]|uniref:Arabinose-5-phosphate isomerase n=1 Tax=Syntrophus gentianae TaxID=43775 RepID=A0A1H7WSV2_9BACT|nr:KpsF/GutQ family sugar-phosphate isomerase [Syntrophus gentianae]SEM23987.1 arabinose-5-phosphate isomerase [Syntrophus gentianae]